MKGLAHIHTQDIIHRDLKPGTWHTYSLDNILIDHHFNVKIIDFGLSYHTHK